MAHILIPVPDFDFDVTEVAVPWKLFTESGHQVTFATEHGIQNPKCDPLLVTGVIFGQLGAEKEALEFYQEMTMSPELKSTASWNDLDVSQFDALILPGGHAPKMKQYLGSLSLQNQVKKFVQLGRAWGAICHGPLVAARAGVLKNKKTTCLPKYMERNAYWLTAWKLGQYYRTYSQYVQDEVIASLSSPADFVLGPKTLLKRGTREDDSAAFVLEDGNYVSARWPGDAYLFSKTILAKLK